MCFRFFFPLLRSSSLCFFFFFLKTANVMTVVCGVKQTYVYIYIYIYRKTVDLSNVACVQHPA